LNISQTLNNQPTTKTKYEPNSLKSEGSSIPSSTTLTNGNRHGDHSFNTAIEAQSFPELPSPPIEGDDE
jgi:hypothetical protein